MISSWPTVKWSPTAEFEAFVRLSGHRSNHLSGWHVI